MPLSFGLFVFISAVALSALALWGNHARLKQERENRRHHR